MLQKNRTFIFYCSDALVIFDLHKHIWELIIAMQRYDFYFTGIIKCLNNFSPANRYLS